MIVVRREEVNVCILLDSATRPRPIDKSQTVNKEYIYNLWQLKLDNFICFSYFSNHYYHYHYNHLP